MFKINFWKDRYLLKNSKDPGKGVKLSEFMFVDFFLDLYAYLSKDLCQTIEIKFLL